ncbi:AraC family ligand binding domain-containing protein [Actinokineospora soli]|uniref:AraC family ligand binding domain-containing protein n=1 Tax=Actinokineospora soli TaxID=1048753 RepID=A0ABW2TKV6_9PSEU
MTGATLRFGGGAAGIERMAASLVGVSFAPHRHDTYAVGMTLTGVQTFRYRGEVRHCLPGEWHVLHPDELHDGAPGTDDGFGYRIFYVDPALVQAAVGGALPFVPDPVVRDPDPALRAYLRDWDRPLDEVEAVELTAAIADTLSRRAGARPALDVAAVSRVRALLADDPTRPHPAAELERVAGLDRWSVARQFRAAYGTSPTRFRTLRRLDVARRLAVAGRPLAEAAAARVRRPEPPDPRVQGRLRAHPGSVAVGARSTTTTTSVTSARVVRNRLTGCAVSA